MDSAKTTETPVQTETPVKRLNNGYFNVYYRDTHQIIFPVRIVLYIVMIFGLIGVVWAQGISADSLKHCAGTYLGWLIITEGILSLFSASESLTCKTVNGEDATISRKMPVYTNRVNPEVAKFLLP